MKTFATLATSAALVGLAATQTVGDCTNGTYIVIARGSYEPPPEGILSRLADQVIERIPGSESVGLDYPATIVDPTYFDSQPDGVRNLTKFVVEYSDKCPSTKLILMGYSQGAHVIGDVLLGSAASGFPQNTPLDTKYLDRVIAVIMMGDPGFVLNLPVNVGNATKGGLFKRSNGDQWAARGLVGRVQSYCDFNDTYCDSGSSGAVHAGYVPEYGAQALDFIVSRFENAPATPSSSSSSSSATAGVSSSVGLGSSTSGVPTGVVTGYPASNLTSTRSSFSTSYGAASSTSASSSGASSSAGPSSSSSPSSSPTPAFTGAANGLRSSAAGYFALAGLFFAGFAFVL